MLASTQTSFGLCSSRMRWPACDVFARQHEGAVDHRRHRAADRAVLDVDILLGELGREVGHLVVECRDLRVDHAQPVMLDPAPRRGCPRPARVPPGAAGSGFRASSRRPGPAGAGARRPRGARTATSCARVRACARSRSDLSAASAFSRAVTVDVRVRISASAWFWLRRRSARSLARSALTPSICARKASARSFATRSSMRATTWPAADARSLQRRHLHHPALGATGDGHDVGGGARIVFVDVREPQVELAAAIDERRQQHGGDGQEARAERQADAAAGQPRAARQDADGRLRNVKRRREPCRSLKRVGRQTGPRG